MSGLLFSDPISSENLQIWNNAAFDASAIPSDPLPWLPLQPISLNHSRTPESAAGKENQSPVPRSKPATTTQPLSGTPFPSRQSKVHFNLPDDNGAIDAEIEETEKEIGRLTARLEKLRAEKRERSLAAGARRGRAVPARFMEARPTTSKKLAEETPSSNDKARRRGRSLGPSEIGRVLQNATPINSASKTGKQPKKLAAESPAVSKSVDYRRRGASLGPAEIYCATGGRQSVGAIKLGSIREMPSRNDASNNGCKKPGKNLQPKTLFKENEEEKATTALASKTVCKGRSRIVPSRYSLVHARPPSIGPASKRRKWSLPEKDGGEPTADVAKRSCVSLPDGTGEGEVTPGVETGGGGAVGKPLARVRTSRGGPETPRDSGPAKRVAQLVGRRTHFGELAVGRRDRFCQNLELAAEQDGEGVTD